MEKIVLEKITAHRTTLKPCFLKPCHQLLRWQPKIYFYQKHLFHGDLLKGCKRNNVNGWKLLFIQLFSFGVCVNKNLTSSFFFLPSYLAVYITVVNPGSENNLKETQTFNSIQRKWRCQSGIWHVAWQSLVWCTWLWTNQRRSCHLANLIGHCFGGTEFPFSLKVLSIRCPKELFPWWLVCIYNIEI